MEIIRPEPSAVPEANLLNWQMLIRHETLRLIKSGTFMQLVSSPELADIAKECSALNRQLLKLAHKRFTHSSDHQS
ncbi:hypothetical protein [Paenibacillus azoreducens]|uniref:Uncharacterized protein n=1 Tax=Paenibacillus azoreducens TaxID=116718 RepID=A0A919YK77_9BACL|nr:hypothetical protein [Paenibacillus azoreducens]GIO49807.1 hypothetical protein J34TS1_45720 [Paenibacillus azoreducens]